MLTLRNLRRIALGAMLIALSGCTSHFVEEITPCDALLATEAGPITEREVRVLRYRWPLGTEYIALLVPCDAVPDRVPAEPGEKEQLAERLLHEVSTRVLSSPPRLSQHESPHMNGLAFVGIRGKPLWIISISPLVLALSEESEARSRRLWPGPDSVQKSLRIDLNSHADQRTGEDKDRDASGAGVWRIQRIFALVTDSNADAPVTRLGYWQKNTSDPAAGWRWLDLESPELLGSIIHTPPSALISRIDGRSQQ